MFALCAAAQGWRPVYLGANLPYSDLRDVVQRIHPDLVGLSIVTRHDPQTLRELLRQARDAVGPSTGLLIGGQGIEGMTEVIRQEGGMIMPASGHLSDLDLFKGDLAAPSS